MSRTETRHQNCEAHPNGAKPWEGALHTSVRIGRQDAFGVLAYIGSQIPVTTTSTALDALNLLAAKLDSVIKNSPVSELEKNARQHFISALAKHGLVTREEYEVQVALLDRARAKLQVLEAKIAALEKQRHQ